jgi:hypothetical protein
MITGGQYVYDKMQDWYCKHAPDNSPLRNRCDWKKHLTQLAKDAHEYAAAQLARALTLGENIKLINVKEKDYDDGQA